MPYWLHDLRGTQGFIPPVYIPKTAKIGLTTDAEYVSNLVNVSATVQFIVYTTGMLRPHDDIFLADIIGYDRLEFTSIYALKIKS